MSSSNPSFFLYTWIMAPMGTSSSIHLDYGSNGHLFKLYTLEVQSSNPELLYTLILAQMGTSSSYTHLKFQAPIPSLFTLGFWIQWVLHNSFKLYTLEAFSLKHNETRSQVFSNTTQAFDQSKYALYNMHM